MALKSRPNGTQHSEWHHVTMSVVYLMVHTTFTMSVYAKLPCNTQVSYLSYAWHLWLYCSNSTSTLLIHAKLTPG